MNRSDNSEREPIRYWQVSPGEEEYNLWPEFKEANIIAMGWDSLGNLRRYSREEDIEKALKEHYSSQYPKDKYPANSITSIKVFSQLIKEGHIIVAKKGASKEVYGIGKVLREYHFVESRADFKHVIDVDWLIGFDKRIEVETSKRFVQWTADSLKPERFEQVKKSILKKYPELTKEFSLLMKSPRRVTQALSQRNWWIEKTYVEGVPERETGKYSFGKALRSPQRGSDGRTVRAYENMREIKKGHIVLHLVDNKAIVGISIVDNEYKSILYGDDKGKRLGYLVTLRDYQKFETPIDRSDILNEKYKNRLLSLLENGHYLFYDKNLELNQGAYLTEAPSPLVEMINDVYKEKNGQDLPFWISETAPAVPILPLRIQASLIETELELASDVLEQVCANLNAGSHIIITGPVGTGKTSFARDICRAAQENQFCDGYVLTTASSDWTTFDTIGGYMPTEEQKLRFEEGKFLEAIRKNKWLIIDEINRADIDKAFGQLFTVLSGQNVELPFKHTNGKPIFIQATNDDKSYFDETTAAYKVGRNWRIIATMNIYDMNFLFEMSYAFMRRFAFVYMDVPEKFGELIESWCKEKKLSGKTADKLKKLTKLAERKLGPAIIEDIVDYLEYRGDGERELAEAIVAYVLPQLEGMEKDRIEKAWYQIGDIFEDRAVPNTIIMPILREVVGIELREIPEPEKV